MQLYIIIRDKIKLDGSSGLQSTVCNQAPLVQDLDAVGSESGNIPVGVFKGGRSISVDRGHAAETMFSLV
jgi:hypothetical protein